MIELHDYPLDGVGSAQAARASRSPPSHGEGVTNRLRAEKKKSSSREATYSARPPMRRATRLVTARDAA